MRTAGTAQRLEPPPTADGSHYPVVVIGAGQAGLAMSYCLTRMGTGHLVLERQRIGNEWRGRRWDSFCLVTPNWQCQLPGYPYNGPDPDGFMPRDEIAAYVTGYAASFGPPVREDTEVTRLRRGPGGGFEIVTSGGELTAGQVVVATGPYHVPRLPRMAARLPAGIVSRHSSQYRSPGALPAGAVLVVGTGQSGGQIAEDLHLAGRQVHLATGSAPRVARRYRGRDVVAWLDEMGHYDRGVDQFEDAVALRLRANHYVTGRDGGHDIDLRVFAREGRHPGRLRARPGQQPGQRGRGVGGHQGLDRRVHRRERHRRGRRVPAAPGLAAGQRVARALPGGQRDHQRDLGDRVPPGLLLARAAGLRRPRLSRAHPRRHQLPRPVRPRPALAVHLGIGPVLRGRQGRRASGRAHPRRQQWLLRRPAGSRGQRGGRR